MDLYPTTGPRYYTNQTQNVGVCKKNLLRPKTTGALPHRGMALSGGGTTTTSQGLWTVASSCSDPEQLQILGSHHYKRYCARWGGGLFLHQWPFLSPPLAMMSARLVINTMDMNTAFSIASIRLTYAPKDGRMRNGRPSQHTPGHWTNGGPHAGVRPCRTHAAWWTCRWAHANTRSIESWTDYEGLVNIVANFPHRAPDHQLAHGDLIWDIYGWWQQGALKAVHKVHSHQTNHDTPGHTWAQQGNALVDLQAGATAWTWWPGEEELWYPLRWQKTEIAFNSLHAKSTWSKGELLQGIAETVFPVNHARNFSATADQGGRADHRDTGFVELSDAETPEAYMKFLNNPVCMLRRPNDWAKQVGFGPASRFWAFMVTLWSPTTPQRWVSWAQLAILYLATTGDYPTHEGQTKLRRTMVAPPARGRQTLERYDFNRPGHCSRSGQSFSRGWWLLCANDQLILCA